jgi:hypothetical protein
MINVHNKITVSVVSRIFMKVTVNEYSLKEGCYLAVAVQPFPKHFLPIYQSIYQLNWFHTLPID